MSDKLTDKEISDGEVTIALMFSGCIAAIVIAVILIAEYVWK